jgi:hypothetical protein
MLDPYYVFICTAGLLYAASLWLSNSAYLYLSVSFIQMTKSLMPGLVYGSGCIVGTEKFKGEVAAIMSLIAFGVVVCAYGEVNLIMVGVVVQLSSLAFEVGGNLLGRSFLFLLYKWRMQNSCRKS